MLASGKRSTYYIDARPTTMSGEGLTVIGALGLTRLQARGWAPRAVGGLTLGADPVAYAIATAARAHGVALDAFTVRRQAKTHGTGRRIEGCFALGEAVVVPASRRLQRALEQPLLRLRRVESVPVRLEH